MVGPSRPPLFSDRLGAFCTDTDAYLDGAAGGPLDGLTFAAKDIFDVAGHVTGGGNPDWKATHGPAERTAWAVRVLVEAGATMVGKTITDEITRGIFGENVHYGTPVNPRAPGRVPGGSSSGSASAVAGGLVDFALGSDTGGSVRVPSSFCGLYGLRPTHGRIPLDGVLLQAPDFDTVGWFARDADLFARVGAVLFGRVIAGRPRRVVIAEDAFELAHVSVRDALRPIVDRVVSLIGTSERVRLAPASLHEWFGHQAVLQTREAWTTVADWVDQVNPRFAFDVTERYLAGKTVTDAELDVARAGRAAVVARMASILSDATIVCLPTTAAPAPPVRQPISARRDIRLRNSALTCIAGLTGSPQISLPLATVDGLPVGLSLLGVRGADETLIAFAREVART